MIVDEIHALAGNKRGVHLALSLERLCRLTRDEPQRIGLSATQRPLDEIARFLVGLDGMVGRSEGLILITFYVVYVIALVAGGKPPDHEHDAFAFGGWRSWLLLTLGLATVIIRSDFTVKSVVSLAEAFEVSQAIIAVLVIGLGTSLPELSISIAAILKQRTELSVGNIIGSNVLDTLLPVGIAAVLSPVWFERSLLVFDLPYVFILTTCVLLLFAIRKGLGRAEGIAVLAIYASYVAIKLTQL